MRMFLTFIIAVAGLILAISECPLFPWLNLAGVLVLLFIAVKVNQHHNRGDKDNDNT